MLRKRIEKIQEILDNNTAAIISDDSNRLYFTGFNSSAGMVVITKNGAWFFIDFRYIEKAKSTVSHMSVILAEKLLSQLKELFENQNIRNILLETDRINLDFYGSLKEKFQGVNISLEKNLTKKIAYLRSIKTEEEKELIKKAQSLTDKTFDYILNYIERGKTEKEIMLLMEFYIRKMGSEGVSFDFIVVSGNNSSLPHGVPTDKPITDGDFITMDFGAVVSGYRSDMTRTVALKYVTDKQRKVYETVLSAQKSALDAIKPDVKCCEIDKIARDLIYNAGYEGCFGHGLGHSVGIEIHENPSFNTRDETKLQKGMVLTVEPGIYLENEFGVRIEDMVYITDNSYENLTRSNKELIIL